jgi:hypothetical protein
VYEVEQISERLIAGETVAEIAAAYPDVTRGHIEQLEKTVRSVRASMGAAPADGAAASSTPNAAASGGSLAQLGAQLDAATGGRQYVAVTRDADDAALGTLTPPVELSDVLERFGAGRYRLTAIDDGRVAWTKRVTVGDVAPESLAPIVDTLAPPPTPSVASLPGVDPLMALVIAQQGETTKMMTTVLASLLETTKNTADPVELAKLFGSSGQLQTYIDAVEKGKELVSGDGGGGGGDLAMILQALQQGAARTNPPAAPAAAPPYAVPGAQPVQAALTAGGVEAVPPVANDAMLAQLFTMIDYAIRVDGEVEPAVEHARTKLPPEMIQQLVGAPQMSVDWIRSECRAVCPAVVLDNAEGWLLDFVESLGGRKASDDDGDDSGAGGGNPDGGDDATAPGGDSTPDGSGG